MPVATCRVVAHHSLVHRPRSNRPEQLQHLRRDRHHRRPAGRGRRRLLHHPCVLLTAQARSSAHGDRF